MLKQWRYYLPLAIFLLLALLLWRGLQLDPRKLPSTFIDKPLPTFKVAELFATGQMLNNTSMLGHVSLLNVWATWCYACQDEHAVLLDIARKVMVYGLAYKDEPQAAKDYLARYGNPYRAVGLDHVGRVAIDLGVYGTPETFVLDAEGIVRYKHIGPITQQVWQETLSPLIERLNAQG
jgi:cytochrome c biogenesis protein CcmG/thiol:disulfide interchange protein DsbE